MIVPLCDIAYNEDRNKTITNRKGADTHDEQIKNKQNRKYDGHGMVLFALIDAKTVSTELNK